MSAWKEKWANKPTFLFGMLRLLQRSLNGRNQVEGKTLFFYLQQFMLVHESLSHLPFAQLVCQ